MDKYQIIAGEVYMARDRQTPVLLVTNRLYALKHKKGAQPTYMVAPREITASRKASDTERGLPQYTDYGYLAVRPVVLNTGKDQYGELLKINVQRLLDANKLPIPENVPEGYQLFLITNLAQVIGEYKEIRERVANENAQAAAEAKARREAYNALAQQANRRLGDQPLAVLANAWDEVPATFTLTPLQLRRLVENDPNAQER